MVEAVIGGIKFRIDFSFLVFAALVFLIKNGAEIFSFFSVCMIHEIGHGLAVCLSGGKISSITFYGTGIIMKTDRTGIMPLKKELFILLSGPSVNIILFLLLWKKDMTETFALLNLCAAVFNLMPYSSLDGGAALLALSDSLPNRRNAVLIFLRAAQVTLPLLLLYGTFTDKQLFSLFCAAAFYSVSEIKRK